ncbi:Palmitoyltransferase PFA4 [Cladobotryum mycophilum]|uniref:Palmitoyltransferase PFA4 n=1 Tax=Cladobotryum mycophilum TaxID=491253 RepID=A0ABR0SL56_9HYPO
MAGFSDAPIVQVLAVPAVCLLIAFLSYFSQVVFRYSSLDPGPLTRNETVVFNALLLCLWVTYYRAVTVDPGRYVFKEQVIEAQGKKWCKKCAAPKPARAHHCRVCGRCIPKMDHHCPWTRNCVSMTTFPHFLRFLVYANVSLWTLGRFLWHRFYALYETRDMPAYLGPSLCALISLAFLALIWFFTSLALGIMLITTTQNWVFNRTTIEGWEVERHEAIIGRGGRDWWDIKSPDGDTIRFEKVEFPYDIGFPYNMAQAMGTANFLLWFWPLAGSPKINKDAKTTGWTWEENGFNRKEGMWPPPDPDKLRRTGNQWPAARRDFAAELKEAADQTPEERKAAFKERQTQDARRRNMFIEDPVEDVEEDVDDYMTDQDDDDGYDAREKDGQAPQEWTNADGERLHDFGVDEDAEDDVEDDVPIAELLRRRKVTSRDHENE